MNTPSKGSSPYPRIWEMVARIPPGKVATYGQIARLCGLAGQARLVGYALHGLPHGLDIPWQRVVNARGRISFPVGSPSYCRQKELLELEGVVFVKGRIDLRTYGWTKKRR
jgi:methylated-DNA-protein-cysteine methyltransferase-like protein